MTLPAPHTPDPNNPLYRPSGLPAFDRVKAEHLEPAMERMLDEISKEFSDFERSISPTWASAVEGLDALMRPLGHGWGIATHLNAVASSDELREAIERVQPKLIALNLRIGQSQKVYAALKALLESDDLNSEQRRIVEQRVLDAELSGVGLEGDAKARFNEIAAETANLSLRFTNNVMDSIKTTFWDWSDAADVEGLPRQLRAQLAATWSQGNDGKEADPDKGPWRMMLSADLLIPFLKHSPRRDLRELVWKAHGLRASSGELDNKPIVTSLLRLRQEQSEALGYKNWAALSTATKMAEVPAIYELLGQLKDAAMPSAERELAALSARAEEAGAPTPLEPWDIAYWQEREREARFDYSEEELRAYFQEPRVLEGLFKVTKDLFGVTAEVATGSVPLWHKDVRFYTLRDDKSGELIAGFYLDLWTRTGLKRPGAWMNECLSRHKTENGLTIPVAYLICNGTPPADGRPPLMSFNDVLTLFHEFGHGLQHMLTHIDYDQASGIREVEWDAVELPSQFMENWCYHEPTVMGMTSHVETGETIPKELFDKIVASRTFGGGLGTLRQLVFGLTDLRLHDGFNPKDDDAPHELMNEVERETSVLPVLDERRQLCAFSHIFAGGYSAGYYSYKWAEVLSADAFGAFEEAGLEDAAALREVGQRFRDTVLGMGGATHPTEVYRKFRGRDATIDALLRHYGFSDAA